MRRTRWLLLVAIAAILGGVGATYQVRKRLLQQQAPQKPAHLPLDITALSTDWEWKKYEGDRLAVHILARSVQQASNSGEVQLGDVRLRIYHKDQTAYDLVRSAKASFAQSDRRLFSEDAVEITLGVPVEGEPKRTLVTIRSSAVQFDTETGKATTGKPADFVFENGTGKSVGASYDPTLKEIRLLSQVELHWKSPLSAKTMKLEAGELLYQEESSTILLQPWSRLTRDQSVVDAATTVVTLKDGEVHVVDAKTAKGRDRYPDREIEYSANQLWVYFQPGTRVEKIDAVENARLVATSKTAATTMTAGRVNLAFAERNGEAVLRQAVGAGGAVVESRPIIAQGRDMPPTRVLRSDTVEIKMRDDGREIATVATHAPGVVDFLPNRPADPRRRLTGFRLYINYGAANRIDTFQAVQDVTTETQAAVADQKKTPVTRTSSDSLSAVFDPKTGQMSRMEQTGKFQYEQGDRRARAERAVLDSGQDLITLESGARVWDRDGSTSADRIEMKQSNGDVAADGRVASSRVPEKKPGSGLLSANEPLQAVARKMVTSNRNSHIRYEGAVTLWQGSSRLQAERVDIDREKRRLLAGGNVVTYMREETKGKQAPVDTIVRAPHLVYVDQTRLAHYSGGSVLHRAGLQVKSTELRAFLSGAENESRLEKAIADGAVEILQTAPDRTRKGTGEHAEYYVAEEKVILRGGDPQLADSKGGSTRGSELTYWANDDRLLVTGAPGKPVSSRIRRN